MNIETLNTVNLDGTPVTYQSISNSSGGGNSGGGGPEMPVIGDGKTYLYIDMSPKHQYDKKVTLFFGSNGISRANAITIDWGDGNIQTVSSPYTGTSLSHTYAKTGKYIISLDIEDGVVLPLGDKGTYYGILGSASDNVYGGSVLTALELGKNIKLESVSFQYCYSLSNVVLGEYIQELNGFINCCSLSSIVIPNNVTSISGFNNCYSLRNIVVGNGVNIIKANAFDKCESLYSIDFSSSLSIPTLENTYSIPNYLKNCSIIVPDALYDEWISATNWSSIKKYIIKKSKWDALQ
jgi:hypothetical protein